MEILILVIALSTAVLLVRHNARIQASRDALAAQQTFEHIACPILVTSNFPDDPTVLQRAAAWREKLRASGNRYSETLPIIPYPFALGADGDGMMTTWRTYQANAVLKFADMLRQWDAQIARENEALHQQFILNQRAN